MDTKSLVISIISFFAGVLVGYFGHDIMRKSLAMDEANSKNLLMLVVSLAWLISVLVSMVNPSYQVPMPVHTIMGIVVGFFFYRPKAQ